jgi:hypothetical protein
MDAAQQTIVRLSQIQAWLQAGGRIEEPVLQRSAYHGMTGRVCVFEVIVNHGGDRRVIALADDPAVYTWLSRQHLAVLDIS